MPVFDTPEPITATLDFVVGTVRIAATPRTDTVVEIRGADESAVNVKAAEQTRISCSGGMLLIRGPKKRSMFGPSGSLDIRIELPEGSELRGASPMGDFICEGSYGSCHLKTSMGDIRVEQADSVVLRTSLGSIRVERVLGDAEVQAVGGIEVGEVGGAATVKNSNGETVLGEIGGELRASASNGPISLDVARAGVDAKTAYGTIRIGRVERGRISLQSGTGELEVGIAPSTAAWLDVTTRTGRVHTSLDEAVGPEAAEETVEVRARTGVGDIIVRRATVV